MNVACYHNRLITNVAAGCSASLGSTPPFGIWTGQQLQLKCQTMLILKARCGMMCQHVRHDQGQARSVALPLPCPCPALPRPCPVLLCLLLLPCPCSG